MWRKASPSTTGFTLIELLVVVAIIGVLATTVLSSLQDSRAAARDARRFQEVRQLQTALELYRNNNNGLYPCLGGADCTTTPAAPVTINPVTLSTAVTTFLSSINFSPTLEGGQFPTSGTSNSAGASIIYRLRSVTGNSSNPDRTSYTIIVRTERGRVNASGTTIPAGNTGWCSINQGIGHVAYNGDTADALPTAATTANYPPCY